MALKIRCPSCRKVFLCKSAEDYPDICPNTDCESRLWTKLGQNREDNDIVLPFISTSGKSKVIDKVYDDMARGSEIRAQAAADQLGVGVSEMSDLKITDLRPTKHVGDVAAVPVSNDVTRQMEYANSRGGKFGFGDGAAYGAEINTGAVVHNGVVVGQNIAPNVGAKTRSVLQQMHGQTYGGNVVSDRPAMETQQPGYRNRA